MEDARRARPDPHRVAAALREQIYVSFTALAVALALGRNDEHPTVVESAATLGLTVLATILAVFLADVISHMAAHSRLPDRAELRHMAIASFGALVVLVFPALLLVLAAVGALPTLVALRIIAIGLAVTVAVVTAVAVRRVRMGRARAILAVLALLVLAFLVVGLELAIH